MRRNARLTPTSVGNRKRSRSSGVVGIALALMMLAVALVLPLGTNRVQAAPGDPMPTIEEIAAQVDWSPPSTVYIPTTGHSIDGVFLSYWRANGGASSFGNPITAEVNVNGRIVQYYEYARFEYWPEDAENPVHLGAIGEELRPQLLMRQGAAAIGNGAVAEMARIARSWLPVTGKATTAEETDSFIYVAATGHTISNGFKTFWDATGRESYLGNPLTEEYQLGSQTYQVFERGQLAWKKNSDPWMVPVGSELAQRKGIPTEPVAQGSIPTYDEGLFVRPELWYEINLSEQYLTVWIGNEVILGTYVSTGREGFDTPPGTFYINTKLESQTMEGVLGGEYYNVPDVPWVMYFTDVGHAIHGAYWHNNFGSVMSHGCVNLPVDTAAYLYSITPIGTRVEIHY